MIRFKQVDGDLFDLLDQRITDALFDAVNIVAEQHAYNVTQVSEPGPPFVGPHSASDRSEHLYKETGAGGRGIRTASSGRSAAVGFTPDVEYMHTWWANGTRLGLPDTYFEVEDRVKNAIIQKVCNG